jgi:multisubunit Na+/H+ antiporter MnhB subunit
MNQPAASTPTARRIGTHLAVGSVLGFAASSFAGPAVIGWWYAPPIKDAFSCASSVRAALVQFVKMQLICAVLGAIAVALAVYLLRRGMKPRS